jgi:purine-binding chemotaxis protein CheW
MSAVSEYVTFGLGDEVFAAPVGMVREILDFRQPFRIPNAPAYLMGLTEVRGRGVPTIDLRMRLGMTPTEPTQHTRIIVLDVTLADRTLSLGLAADRVFEVTAFRPENFDSAPDIGVRWRSDYISGVVRRENGFVVLIDLAKLLSSEEAAALYSAQTRAA